MKRVIISSLRDYREVESFVFCDSSYRKYVVTAAINTRDLSKDMIRCRSSNVWSYTFNVRKNGDRTGDLLMQFKNKNGGAGDIYIYYDVPVKVYQKLVTAPSKGHYFHKYIRNTMKYSKLTGDRKGKLKNAIN